MPIPINIQLSDMAEAAIAIKAVEAYRASGAADNSNIQEPGEVDQLADRIHSALKTSTFTDPSRVVTRVLLSAKPFEQVPVSALVQAFVKEKLASSDQQAWNRVRAAFATLSWLMDQRLTAQDKAGAAKPIDVFASRSLDEQGRRLYRLTDAGRIAAQRFFEKG